MKHIPNLVWAAMLALASACFVNAMAALPGGCVVAERGLDWQVLQKTAVEHGANHLHQYTEPSR